MRLDLKPGESARIRYVLRCPLRGHYTIGPVSLRHRNTFNLGVEEMKVDHHSDVIVFPQVKDVEEAFLRSRTPKMYTGATTLRTPAKDLNSTPCVNTSPVTRSRASTGRPSPVQAS